MDLPDIKSGDAVEVQVSYYIIIELYKAYLGRLDANTVIAIDSVDITKVFYHAMSR